MFPPGGFGTYFAFVDDTWRSVHLLFRIARIPHSTLRLGSICMDLRARVLGILEGDSFLASLGNVASDQIVRLSFFAFLVSISRSPSQSSRPWWFWL